MTERIQQGKLAIAKELYDFIENEALPGSGIDSATYWKNFEQVVVDLSPKNKALLEKREALQKQIDEWHRNNTFEHEAYKAFLTDIGYLEPEVADFQITTENVDEEIALLAGAQLVVPVRNARYSLNAANARWGSLYDALYGFDVISDEGGAEKGKGYNPARGAKVIAFAKNFLNETFPLAQGSHDDVTKYAVESNALVVTLKDGRSICTDRNRFAQQWSARNHRHRCVKPNRSSGFCWRERFDHGSGDYHHSRFGRLGCCG